MNVANIRKLVKEQDLDGLDKLEQEIMDQMDDDQNDLEELGGQLTDILGARQILERVRDESVDLKDALRDFVKNVRDTIN